MKQKRALQVFLWNALRAELCRVVHATQGWLQQVVRAKVCTQTLLKKAGLG
jgi:hypothetical protein